MVGAEPGRRRALPSPQPDPPLLAPLPRSARVRLAEDVARGRARLRGAPLRSHPRLHPPRRRDRRPGDRDRGGTLVHAVVPARGRARARAGDRLTRAVALLVAGAALLAVPSSGVAGVRLECTAESRADAAPTLDVVAVTTGDEPARDVRPEVIYAHRIYAGEAAALDPGARHEWKIA